MSAQRGGGRRWLDVPFAENSQAKALGARWDPAARRWFAGPAAAPQLLDRWAARPEVPDPLPGEDRSFGAGLYVDLIPASVWWSNVRSHTTPGDWERLRRMLIRRAASRCELCGAAEDRPARRWLEAHERFAYDDRAGVQTLRRLVLVCTWCHDTTHYGLAEISGHGEHAFAHLCAVTGMSDAQARDHVDAAYALWRTRSDRSWTLDLSILTTAGITLNRPDAPSPAAAGSRADPGSARSAYERLMRELVAERGGDPDAPIPTAEQTLAAIDAAAAAHRRDSTTHPTAEPVRGTELRPEARSWWRRRQR